MQTRLEITRDGSHTLYLPELNEHYHSTFGAVQESMHIFIEQGLDQISRDISPLNILEMGFGTGLNAFLTFLRSEKYSGSIHYTSIEKFPLDLEIVNQLNFPGILDQNFSNLFRSLHEAPWNEETSISENFTIVKIHKDFLKVDLHSQTFDLVYYDAFGPDVQPELWSDHIFQKIGAAMRQKGVLVTYSVKGSVRRALSKAGFDVAKIPGPPGKREITRAVKK